MHRINMMCTEQSTMVGTSIDGSAQTVFNVKTVTAVPCVFIHEDKKHKVLGDRKLMITHKVKPLLGYVQPRLLECSL